jgi:uncharacterized membrane protein YidH (DUF202 family)
MYEFNLVWFFVGIAVTLGGVAFVRFYKEIADNMGGGVASYNRYKIIGMCVCGAGILIAFNLHNMVIAFIGNLIFGGTLK